MSGDVSIDTPDLDPARGLVELPSNLADASRQIAQGCTARGRENASSFIATGRGGLPLSPNEPLRGHRAIANWVDLPSQAADGRADKFSTPSINKSTVRIVEAQALVVDAKGDVFLVAQSNQSNSSPSAVSCSQ